MRRILGSLAAVILLGCVGTTQQSVSQEVDSEVPDPSHQVLARQVANTAIVWIDAAYIQENVSDPEIVTNTAKLFSDVISHYIAEHPETNHDNKDKIIPEAVYDGLHGFAVPVSAAVAQAALDDVAKLTTIDNPKTEQEKAENERIARLLALAHALSVSADMIVSMSDADCSGVDITDLMDSQVPQKPNGVKRVTGTLTAPGSYVQKVWIVDSGLDYLDSNPNSYLNIDRTDARNCHHRNSMGQWECEKTGYKDKIGHGTMIAGIIASKGPQVTGVAPGAVVVPVRIFNKKPEVKLSGPVLAALNYIKNSAAAKAGDIVNMSWGAAWLENMDRSKNQLETVMGYPAQSTLPANPGLIGVAHYLTDTKKLKLVAAAGNVDLSTRPSQVGLAAPAIFGAYPAGGVGGNRSDDGCKICTVSAVDDNDRFWWVDDNGAAVAPDKIADYGSNYGYNPPDFAEPGVDVWSLWPREKPNNTDYRANKCSGTSFAAAHLSGILVRSATTAGAFMDPAIGGSATDDPDIDGINDPNPQTMKRDPIAISTR